MSVGLYTVDHLLKNSHWVLKVHLMSVQQVIIWGYQAYYSEGIFLLTTETHHIVYLIFIDSWYNNLIPSFHLFV